MRAIHKRVSLIIAINIFSLFFFNIAHAIQLAPTYTYKSYATINPEPKVHEQIWSARMEAAYAPCAAAALAKGGGICDKFEPYDLAPSPESITRNGYESTYILKMKHMHVSPQPNGGYSIISERFFVNNLRIDLHISCPAGSTLKNLSSSSVVCDCKTDECLKPALNGPSTPQTCTAKPQEGNPINVANGNKYQKEVDHSIAGKIELHRSYNSSTGQWSHNYSDRLEISNRDIALIASDGRVSYFLDDGSIFLKSTLEAGYLTRSASGFVYISESNRILSFDASGKLISSRSINQPEVKIIRTSEQIIISDMAGNTATLTEDSLHQPLSFSTSGFSALYNYNSSGQLESVTKSYSGAMTRRSYHYEDSRDSRLLTGITDEKGVRFATWAYDDQGRAISSEHANGAEKITVEYRSDSSTYVTNEFGKLTEYQFARFDGAKRLMAVRGMPSANCPFSNSSFTYNSFGQLLVSTNNRGNRTTYLYNDRGLERSRTEAAGTPQARTITTEWHPTLFLPLVVTEPNRITTYQYDTQGRQLSRTVEAR